MNDNNRLWTINELVAFLKVSYPTILTLIKKDKLHAIRLGKQWRVTQKALDEFLGTDEPDTLKIYGDNGEAVDVGIKK